MDGKQSIRIIALKPAMIGMSGSSAEGQLTQSETTRIRLQLFADIAEKLGKDYANALRELAWKQQALDAVSIGISHGYTMGIASCLRSIEGWRRDEGVTMPEPQSRGVQAGD